MSTRMAKRAALRLAALGLAGVMLAPGRAAACAACYGANIDDRMADGMNWAIMTLGAIVFVVLGAFLTFLIHIIRKSEAVEAARTAGAATLRVKQSPAPAPVCAPQHETPNLKLSTA